MGLFGYKKVIHPVRTTRRAAMRSVTPKPIRKVHRAATTVRHPGSSLEGAAKASLSRSVSRSAKRTRRTSSPSGSGGIIITLIALVAFIIYIAAKAAWYLFLLVFGLTIMLVNAIRQRRPRAVKVVTTSQVTGPKPPPFSVPTSAAQAVTTEVTSEHYEQLLGLPPK